MTSTPSTPAHVVDRPGLRSKLDGSLSHPLTLVVAPAGGGKSVLLAQWIAGHPELDFVCLEITAADDDPVRFSRRLLGGLSAINPDFADLAPLISVHGGGIGDALLDALGAQMVELPDLVIVLDDLHHLSNSTLIGDLGRLVELLPPNVHLVLSSRVDLPLAWSRHRLRQDITEIRQSDLALDTADAELLIERITGRSLGSDCVAALVGRTEGWAAGLQLAGMTIRVHQDPDDFVAQFSGTDRLIADYLTEEVLGAQSDDRRHLLLQLSVLDTISAGLIGHITGEPNAQLVLEELERESMFLLPLDTRREWFRFHHLFRDLLRFRLRVEDPGLEPLLLRQAASWHLERDDVTSAVECLLSAHDWDGVLDVVMGRGSEVFERGEMATVIRWIEGVPESVRKHRHDVSLLLAMLLGTEGLAARAENVLWGVTADPGASDGERACAQVLRAGLVQWRTTPQFCIDSAGRALDMLKDLGDDPVPVVMNLTDPSSLETIATISGGRAHFLVGDFQESRRWLQRGLATAGASYSVWRVSGLGSLALLEAWCGRVELAESLADEALAIARAVGMLAHPSSADAYLAVTLAALERGEPRRAALSLHEGSLRANANRRAQLSWIAHLELALLQAADGQTDEAMGTIRAARTELGAPPPPIVAQRLQSLRCRMLRLEGSYGEAWRTLGESDSADEVWYFERIAVALSRGEADVARKTLDSAPASAGPNEPLSEVRRLILEGWISDAEGSAHDAEIHLSAALDVAHRHGLVEVFAQAGPLLVRLVARVEGARPEMREAVLRRARAAHSPLPGNELVDPMTDRELEILSYLPSRFTNAEMAERCYVSVNTIKTHMAHIYRKLDVTNRNRAIIRAQELGLL